MYWLSWVSTSDFLFWTFFSDYNICGGKKKNTDWIQVTTES